MVWFWIDKPAAGQFGLPPPGDSMAQNFQRSIDLLKAGYPDMAYLYIWHAHYLVLSVVLGILLAVMYRALSDQLARRSRRGRYYPHTSASPPGGGSKAAPVRPESPSSGDASPGNAAANDDAAK